MKLEELMLNDWVLYNENPCKVARISEPLFLEKDGKVFYAPIEKISPLPLTAEILEKNGFHHHLIAEKGFTREEWNLSDDYYDIVVSEWSDSIWVFRYECTEMNTPHEQRVFGYVHELQHALRECGIDKDIIL